MKEPHATGSRADEIANSAVLALSLPAAFGVICPMLHREFLKNGSAELPITSRHTLSPGALVVLA